MKQFYQNNSSIHARLDIAKKTFKLIVVDYDGTIFGGSKGSKYNHQAAASLLIKIIIKGKIPVVISARDASFKRYVSPLLLSELSKLKGDKHYYFSGGNGAYLVKVSRNEEKTIYNHSLNEGEISTILRVYDEALKQLNIGEDDIISAGVKTFADFLVSRKEWESYIPKELLTLSDAYKGALFIELSKISMVLPEDPNIQRLFIDYIINNLPDIYNIEGDNSFSHVSKKARKNGALLDGKLNAVRTILDIIGLSKEELVAFGDSPSGNDREMLRFLPNSFTNDKKYICHDNLPPHSLSGEGHPVENVHIAIEYLIGTS